ncbi:hypothetical protein [Psychrobacter celer]|uniref:hypothetical protein n=1 Tax=Psychrobacter celer TaxID=306572 RepID=UPI003FD49508
MTLFAALKPPYFSIMTSGMFAFVLAATGCQSSAESTINASAQSTNPPVTTDMSQQTLKQQALRIQRALANNDYARITKDIHPTRGVRFSMYAYVRPESDKVFSREQYAQYLQQSKIRFTWGERDGTGEPLIIPLPEYLDTWVKAKTFNDATLSVNEFQKSGNSINNLNKIYQNSDVVEFYYKGSDEYSGLDWRALRLVFDDYQGKRYLVAVITDQWTI